MDQIPKRDRTGRRTTAPSPEEENVPREGTEDSRQLFTSDLDSFRSPAHLVVQRSMVVVERE